MERQVVNRRKNKTYGINEIYKFYKKEHNASLKTYTELYTSYSELVESLESQIYTINNKLGIYQKGLLEADNIELIKDKQGKLYNSNDGYISLLRGYYKKLNKAKLEQKNYYIQMTKLRGSKLTPLEFKFIYKMYNFHMSNATLLGYRKFYLGGVLGRIVIDTFNNQGRKRGIDWGESNKIKEQLLAQGKELYTKEKGYGEKWLITYNHKEFDAFWKWKSMSTALVRTHSFKPTNYRPTIILDDDGKQLTTRELEEQSTIDEVLSYKIGNTQKSTIITNLDESYFNRYNDDYVLEDFKINYKTKL
jgi:hypothetical protein